MPRTAVTIDECKVGDVVTFYLHSSWHKPGNKQTGVGTIIRLDATRNTVRIDRGPKSWVVPPSRIVGFHPSGTPL